MKSLLNEPIKPLNEHLLIIDAGFWLRWERTNAGKDLGAPKYGTAFKLLQPGNDMMLLILNTLVGFESLANFD